MSGSDRRSLREELRNNFIFVAVVSILFVTLISNVSINMFFSDYLRSSRERDDQKVVGYVEKVYQDYNALTPDAIMSIIHYAFSESVTVILKDDQGRPLWSSNSGDMMYCVDGTVVEESTLEFRNYPLSFEGTNVSSVDVGRVKSIITSIEDKRFLISINLVFAAAIVFSVLIAIISSSRVAGRFLRPIYGIRENINRIKEGKYKEVVPVASNTHELDDMSMSMEELSMRLKEQEILRRRMTTDMAHELRTPLATIQSHIEAFMDGVWQADLEKLSIVHGEVAHLTRLIKELSDLAIIENDEIKINREEIDLSRLLREIGEGFEPMVINKNITLSYDLQEEVFVTGDRNHFHRIFINILSNSYKYTNEGGEIRIVLKAAGNGIEVAIKDNGIGIPKSDLKMVFERFYRSDMSRSRGTGGTGIGLTITKTLVEANGGSINIESEPGKGTIVSCRFKGI